MVSVATKSAVWYLGDGMSGSDRDSLNRKRYTGYWDAILISGSAVLNGLVLVKCSACLLFSIFGLEALLTCSHITLSCLHQP